MDAAAERHPEVPYEPVLIDATYAGLISGAADGPLVIPTLNRDGDLLSDLVMPMFGSIAGAESILLALDDELRTAVAMAEAPHGTAPALEGKDVANPMAMMLACAAVLHYAGERGHEGAERGLGGRLRRDPRGRRRRHPHPRSRRLRPGPRRSATRSPSGSAREALLTRERRRSSEVCRRIGPAAHKIARMEGATSSAPTRRRSARRADPRRSARSGRGSGSVVFLVVLILVLIAVRGHSRRSRSAASTASRLGSIFALGAVGLTLVYGILKLVNFAHGDFLTFGAYVAYIVNVSWGGPLVLGILFAIVATALLGIALEKAMWGPMRARGAGPAAAPADGDRAGLRDPLRDPVRASDRQRRDHLGRPGVRHRAARVRHQPLLGGRLPRPPRSARSS